MKKIPLVLLLILFLSACGSDGNTALPALEDRLIESETSEVDPNEELTEPIQESPVIEGEVLDPNFTIPEGMEDFQAYLPILMFHYIEDVSANDPDQVRYNLSLSPEILEEYLIYFQENNIETLTFWDMKAIIEGEREIPEKAVMLTFDDGHLDHYESAFPLLEEYNMKGVFFIITEKTSNDPVHLTWDQVREMVAAGHEIGSHTITHRHLNELGDEDLLNELVDSKATIEAEIGLPVISLCYPVGKYDARVIEVVKAHYLFARTTEAGKDFALTNQFSLPTTRVFPTTGVGALEVWFGG